MLRCVVPVLALRMPFVCCYAASPSPVHWGMRACRVGRGCSRLRSPQRSPRYRASSCGFVLRLGLDSRCVVARWGCVAASLHCPNMGRARRFLVRVGGLGDAALLCALCHFGDCGLFRLRGVSRARPSYGGRCWAMFGCRRWVVVLLLIVALACVLRMRYLLLPPASLMFGLGRSLLGALSPPSLGTKTISVFHLVLACLCFAGLGPGSCASVACSARTFLAFPSHIVLCLARGTSPLRHRTYPTLANSIAARSEPAHASAQHGCAMR